MPLDQRRDIQPQEIVLQIVEGDALAILASGQQSAAMQAAQEIPRSVGLHAAGVSPQGANRRDRNFGVFGKYRQFEITVAFRFNQRVGAEAQRAEDAAIGVIEKFQTPAL